MCHWVLCTYRLLSHKPIRMRHRIYVNSEKGFFCVLQVEYNTLVLQSDLSIGALVVSLATWKKDCQRSSHLWLSWTSTLARVMNGIHKDSSTVTPSVPSRISGLFSDSQSSLFCEFASGGRCWITSSLLHAHWRSSNPLVSKRCLRSFTSALASVTV